MSLLVTSKVRENAGGERGGGGGFVYQPFVHVMNCGARSDEKGRRLRWISWATDGRNCLLWVVCWPESAVTDRK